MLYSLCFSFQPNTRLCLSMSDFHPETWNPMVCENLSSFLFTRMIAFQFYRELLLECICISYFQPFIYVPMSVCLCMQWSVGTILMGLYSFMQEETPTFGSTSASDAQRRKFAKDSLEFNLKNK